MSEDSRDVLGKQFADMVGVFEHASGYDAVIDDRCRQRLMLDASFAQSGANPVLYPKALVWWEDKGGVRTCTTVADYLAVWGNLANPDGPVGQWLDRRKAQKIKRKARQAAVPA